MALERIYDENGDGREAEEAVIDLLIGSLETIMTVKGVDTRLVQAQLLLQQARQKLSNYIDGVENDYR